MNRFRKLDTRLRQVEARRTVGAALPMSELGCVIG